MVAFQEINSTFLQLVKDGGAFSRLETAVLQIRLVLINAKLPHDEEKTLGHGGLPGEYSNSLWPAYRHAALALKKDPDTPLGNSMQILLIQLAKKSQLSVARQKSDIENQSLPVIEAFPIQIALTRQWAGSAKNLSEEDKLTMFRAIQVCEEEFDRIIQFKNYVSPQSLRVA